MKLPTTGSLLEQELAIQSCINAAGCLLSEQSLLSFDTDGRPIKVGNTSYYSKGVEKKLPKRLWFYSCQSPRLSKWTRW